MRDLELAKVAYLRGDTGLSKQVHAKIAASKEEGHQPSGALLKSVVFGALDGILTTFGLLSGGAGGNLSPTTILTLGFSIAIAEGLAMGLGDALSNKAENEHALRERQREFWEYDHYLEGEMSEMVQFYVDKGMSRPDAVEVVNLIAPHRAFFVDIMTIEELGLQLPNEDENPWKDGFVTFVSFVAFACLPLLVYAILPLVYPVENIFLAASFVTFLALFVLGGIKSLFSSKSWYRSGFEMSAIGGSIALAAYVIGAITSNMTGGIELPPY